MTPPENSSTTAEANMIDKDFFFTKGKPSQESSLNEDYLFLKLFVPAGTF